MDPAGPAGERTARRPIVIPAVGDDALGRTAIVVAARCNVEVGCGVVAHSIVRQRLSVGHIKRNPGVVLTIELPEMVEPPTNSSFNPTLFDLITLFVTMWLIASPK